MRQRDVMFSDMQPSYRYMPLGNGKAEVFYEYNGEKTDLFTIEPGEEKKSKIGPFSSGTIYITVKTIETCDEGKFEFSLN